MMGWMPTAAKGTEPWPSPLCSGQWVNNEGGFPKACWEQLETVKLCQSLQVTEPSWR